MAKEQYYHGVGKRKTSIAQVKLFKEPGTVVVNGKPFTEAFGWDTWQTMINRPLDVTNNIGKCSIQVKVAGGGIVSQAGAIRHGIARALDAMDEELKPVLKKNGLLTRDSRIKERKKYGLSELVRLNSIARDRYAFTFKYYFLSL